MRAASIVLAFAAAAAALRARPARAGGDDDLAALINDYRGAPHACDGR
jgi:hypothetical protein